MPHYNLTQRRTRRLPGGQVAPPARPSLMRGTGYTCPELQPDPSILPSRMVAHKLPSRVGDLLYWPDGRITDPDGKDAQP